MHLASRGRKTFVLSFHSAGSCPRCMAYCCCCYCCQLSNLTPLSLSLSHFNTFPLFLRFKCFSEWVQVLLEVRENICHTSPLIVCLCTCCQLFICLRHIWSCAVSVAVAVAVFLNVSDGWRNVTDTQTLLYSRAKVFPTVTPATCHNFLSDFLADCLICNKCRLCPPFDGTDGRWRLAWPEPRQCRQRQRWRRRRRRPPFLPKRTRNCYWFYISLLFEGVLCFMKCASSGFACPVNKQADSQQTALRGSLSGGPRGGGNS